MKITVTDGQLVNLVTKLAKLHDRLGTLIKRERDPRRLEVLGDVQRDLRRAVVKSGLADEVMRRIHERTMN